MSIPRWDPATGTYFGPESDSVVCCVVAFTAPRNAAVFAPMSGDASNTGASFWRDTTSGEVVVTGTSLLSIQVHSSGDQGIASDVAIVFTPAAPPGKPCPSQTGDSGTACYGQGPVANARLLGTVAGGAIPGFGAHTVVLKHSGMGGDLLGPERLRDLYGLRD